jgi:ganglioside GM2 activator
MKILLSVLCTIALPALARVVMKQERTNHVLSVLPFKLKPVTFQWDNCSGSQAVDLRIRSGSISPDPVPLPGTITVAVNFTLTKTLRSPLKAEVTLEKRVGNSSTYLPIPCIDNIGSCTYDDLCELIPYIDECPPPLSTYHIPCQCPFAAGNYSLPQYEFDLPYPGNLPSWLVSGDYYGKAKLTDADGDPAGCYEAKIGLKLD